MGKRSFHSYVTRDINRRDNLRRFLKGMGVYYELSDCFTAYHFEILADPEQVDIINAFLDRL